jgi:type II secretory pathway predicted ATPase ExeA
MLVVGKKATGKTSMAQVLAALLAQEQRVVVRNYFPQNFPNQEATLRILLSFLQVDWRGDFEQSFQHLKDVFVHQAVKNKPYFVMVEQNNAHELGFVDAIFHELLQLRQAGQPVFHLVWFANEKPTQTEYLFPQDIDEVLNLPNMTYREMVGLIRYRCQVVGQKHPPFTQEALKQIFHHTQGNPGLVISLCDFALDETLGEIKNICGVEQVDTAWYRWTLPIRNNLFS